MPSRIDNLIAKCRSWDEFVELVNSIPKSKNKMKGDLFERLTQVYLQTTPAYASKLKNVFLLSDKNIPERLRAKLNLPENDEGIDLICETRSGEYWSVQCKYKSDQSVALTYGELSTFNSLSFNACNSISLGLVVHTSTKPVKKSNLMPKVSEIGLEKWLDISHEEWKRIINACLSNALKPPKKRNPKKHQKAAIADALEHFVNKSQKRGKLIMPCGTGKSLTSFWIARALKAKSIVVAVPSLALVRQCLADWTAEYLAEGIIPDWLAVCSDQSVGSTADADSTVATVYEMGIPTNPSEEQLDDFLKKRTNSPKIVFTTYQSADKLCDAARRNKVSFDLLIADEAHKTAGRKSKSFATLLFDENIKIKKRLFMTATERVYSSSSDSVVSMDNVEVYGATCHHLSFKEAIKRKVICDYKIVTIAVSEPEIDALIREKADLAVTTGNKTIETDANSLAAGIAMQKAFKKFGIKHAVTFHSSINRAVQFKEQQEDLPNNSHISHSHISSKLSAGQRAKLLKGFVEEKRSLVTNARCLTEGVDIKAIDCIGFIDPKRSTVDIVQAAGRAMRQSKETGKKIGYIVVPLIIKNGESLEDVAQSENFNSVLKIITSLSTQDERISEELKIISCSNARPIEGMIKIDDDIKNILKTSISEIEQVLKLKIWKRVGKANWLPFEDARAYARSLNLKTKSDWITHTKTEDFPPNVPILANKTYKNSGWIRWGDWLGTGNVAYFLREYRPFENARDYARSLKLKNGGEWYKYTKTGELPGDIPANPNQTYKKDGWISMGDWLGTGYVANQVREYRSFTSAKNYVRSLALKNQDEWRSYVKSGELPGDIPSAPHIVYKQSGWVSMGDWLGTGYVANQTREYRPFEEARDYARSLKLKNKEEWDKHTKTSEFPVDIPVAVARIYKKDGWINMGDWLGTGRVANFLREYRSFKKARAFARSLKLNGQKEWILYTKSGELPSDIPAYPSRTYKKDGWMGMGDWLGTGRIPAQQRKYRSFKKARAFARSLKLNGQKEWILYTKSGELPDDIPAYPNQTYKKDGWMGMGDWLGTGRISTRQIRYRSFKKARAFARSLKLNGQKEWILYTKSGELPDDIPAAPHHVYKKQGWLSTSDWLGKHK